MENQARFHPEIKTETLIKMHKEGLSGRDIAKIVGIHNAIVYKRLKGAGYIIEDKSRVVKLKHKRGQYKYFNSKSIQQRIEENSMAIPDTGCVLWTGCTSYQGYAQTRFMRKTLNVHRVVWELYNGPILDGLWVLHHCDTPACINPLHLFLGTHQDNMQDRQDKHRNYKGKHADWTYPCLFKGGTWR